MKHIIKSSVAPLYEKPDRLSLLTDEVLHGWQVDILDETSSFYKIKTFYNYTGYIEKHHINKASTVNKNIVTTSFADILSKPEIKSKRILTIPKGSFVDIGEVVNDYTEITLPDNNKAYIRTEKITPHKEITPTQIKNEEAFRDTLIKNAFTYADAGYRWGGKTPQGVDCSALVFMSYFMAGILIYRDAQIKEGFAIKEIPKEKLKKGDLIFFEGHVGMYTMHDTFIHSSDKNGGVKLDNLSKNLPWEYVGCGSLF